MTEPAPATDGPLADQRLHRLGLTTEQLTETLEIGYSTASACTNHDPIGTSGYIAWAKSVGHLRDLLVKDGWTIDRTNNYETTVHPTGAHAIAIIAGTADTGSAKPSARPRTRRPKGAATTRAVRVNAEQLELGHGTSVFAGTHVNEIARTERKTYVLLHFHDIDAEEIRCELSLPRTMVGGIIVDWHERIVLPAIQFAGPIDVPLDDEFDDVIDIDVQRRAT